MEKKRDWLLPASILIAAILISLSLVYSAGSRPATVGGGGQQGADLGQPSEIISPLSEDDHIRGSNNPSVVVVEYSDLECPFCKSFHSTMQRVLNEYDKEVAWVYRQFPLESIHPKAVDEALASECAAELGGNDAFWNYIDRIFEITPSNNGLDLALLPDIAEEIGLDRGSFQSCLDSGRTQAALDKDLEDVEKLDAWSRQNLGRGAGTPYSVVVNLETGASTIIPGALPFEQVTLALDRTFESN